MTMHRTNLVYQCRTIALTLSILIYANSVFAINKCTVNDKVTYTDLPCPEKAHSFPFTQQVISPNDPKAAKRQHLTNQKKLRQISQQKAKEEKQQQREARAMARHVKKEKDQKIKCNELDLKRKAARQHQTEVQFKGNRYATEKARLRVKQADNKYAHYCKS